MCRIDLRAESQRLHISDVSCQVKLLWESQPRERRHTVFVDRNAMEAVMLCCNSCDKQKQYRSANARDLVDRVSNGSRWPTSPNPELVIVGSSSFVITVRVRVMPRLLASKV